MELLERYLHAIKFWLPRSQEDDIVAELSEDLRSQIEEREAKLGHKLDNFEMASLLKERGRPMLVASRYLPQGYLIGPDLFPIYRRVLMVVALCYLPVWLLGWIGLGMFHPLYHSDTGALVGGMWATFWLTTIIAVGAVTVVFAVFERFQAGKKFLDDWNPLELPAVRDPLRISRLDALVQIAVNLMFVVWVSTGMWSQVIFDRAGVRVTLAPAWRGVLWVLVLLAAANVALASVNLFRRQWDWRTALTRLLLDCGGSAVVCWCFRANVVREILAPALSVAKATEIVNLINTIAARAFPFAVITCVVIIVLSNANRLLRLRPKTGIPKENALPLQLS